jgi:uncharacterized protein (DUF2267 family)
MAERIPMDVLLARLVDEGLVDEVTARRALDATVAVLGERLVEDEARALAEVLPTELVAILEAGEHDSDFDADELFERVRRREQTTAARARESAEVVLAVLGEHLGQDRRHRIARGLPGLAAELVLGEREGERERGEPPPHAVAPLAPRVATIASSGAGSTHPLSESGPAAGQTHSVARNPSPHEETKLSGAKGLTQERLDDTLGSGRAPGPTRPIADSGKR